MGGIFSSPSAPPPIEPAPTREDPAIEDARKAEQLRNRKSRGFAATILAGDDTEDTQPLSVAAQLVKGGPTRTKLGGTA